MAFHSLIYTPSYPQPHHRQPPDPTLSLQPSSSTTSHYRQNQPILNLHCKKVCNSHTRKTSVVCSMAAENKVMSGDRMLVFVPPHPLIKHWVSVLRNEHTPCPVFKSAMAELGRLLMYEASRDWLPMITGEIQSPMGVASVEFVDPREPVAIVPILRAGLALAEHAPSIFPATKTYHLGCLINFLKVLV